MRTRMQSMANIFNKINRVVRDLSGQLGKSIDLEIEGKGYDPEKGLELSDRRENIADRRSKQRIEDSMQIMP